MTGTPFAAKHKVTGKIVTVTPETGRIAYNVRTVYRFPDGTKLDGNTFWKYYQVTSQREEQK